MPRPEDLYRAVILDHARHPRHAAPLPAPCARGEAHNPLCGDRATFMITVAGDRVTAAACATAGCALCVAAGSILAAEVHGRDLAAARALVAALGAAAAGEPPPGRAPEAFAALAAVGAFPARRRCVTLAGEALAAALDEVTAAAAVGGGGAPVP